MADKDNKGFMNRFTDWVNADAGLPTLEELNSAHAHETHDGHASAHYGQKDHAEHRYNAHDAVPADHAEETAAGVANDAESPDSAEDDELQYPDSILTQESKAEPKREQPQRKKTPPRLNAEQKKRVALLRQFYFLLAGVMAVLIIAVLLSAVSGSPDFGSADNPSLNEVYTRYVEEGTKETGATNIVAAMILDYRAFDTLGESVMLFTATMAVVMLLRETKRTSGNKEKEGEA